MPYGGGGGGQDGGALCAGSSNRARDAADGNTGTSTNVLAELLNGVGITTVGAVLVGAVPDTIDESGVGAEAGHVVSLAVQGFGRVHHVGNANHLKARSAAVESLRPPTCRDIGNTTQCAIANAGGLQTREGTNTYTTLREATRQDNLGGSHGRGAEKDGGSLHLE